MTPSGGDTLQDLSFGLVVLDEGSQCCEPESLIPLVKVRALAQLREGVSAQPSCALPSA